MVEALVALVWGIVEAVLHAMAAIAEWFVGLFVAGAGMLGILDLIALVAVLLLELMFWLCLAAYELLRAIFQRRRLERIAKPVLWRPSKFKRGRTDQEVHAHEKKPEIPS